MSDYPHTTLGSQPISPPSTFGNQQTSTNFGESPVPIIDPEPKTSSTTSSSGAAPQLNNAANTVINSATAAADTVKNHPITQNAINGPVATSVKDEYGRTSNEFSNLAASRGPSDQQAATGQPLTHYHSFFTTLLSWNNPRASGLAYVAIVIFIFAARYLHILRYAFKLTWVTLGITVLAELAGQFVLGNGLTSQVRPKKYYTLSKDTLNALVGDVHELINFFVIETQRIVFVENTLVSGAAFVAAFLSYYLIKIVPVWGLSLIGVSVLFLAPLIYKSNKELIDAQLNKAASIAGQQTEQIRSLAAEQAARASSTTKQYVGDYSAKAQELIGNARGRSTSPVTTKKDTIPASLKSGKAPLGNDTKIAPGLKPTTYKSEDFPVAPKQEFTAPPIGESVNKLRTEEQPLI